MCGPSPSVSLLYTEMDVQNWGCVCEAACRVSGGLGIIWEMETFEAILLLVSSLVTRRTAVAAKGRLGDTLIFSLV